jgi:hypothetical protein
LLILSSVGDANYFSSSLQHFKERGEVAPEQVHFKKFKSGTLARGALWRLIQIHLGSRIIFSPPTVLLSAAHRAANASSQTYQDSHFGGARSPKCG